MGSSDTTALIRLRAVGGVTRSSQPTVAIPSRAFNCSSIFTPHLARGNIPHWSEDPPISDVHRGSARAFLLRATHHPDPPSRAARPNLTGPFPPHCASLPLARRALLSLIADLALSLARSFVLPNRILPDLDLRRDAVVPRRP
ncbi:hypothetical protein NL676_032370 [Syzygium grande]|nr:hypothetical protein NL676_032370 [Syzygium grande]